MRTRKSSEEGRFASGNAGTRGWPVGVSGPTDPYDGPKAPAVVTRAAVKVESTNRR